jgi:hypothetical protein
MPDLFANLLKSHKVGEGSYGCVYQPPIPCKAELTRKAEAKAETKAKKRTRVVGKILREKNAEVELKLSTVLQAIPDWKNYFILQEEADCDSSNFARARHTLASECGIMDRAKNSDLIQLLSSYGGDTLFDTPITRDFKYVAAFRHMLEGGVRLESQGVCHFDIHEGNVVQGLRLIDFGSGFLGDSATEKTVRNHTYSFSPDYPPQPPELSVQNGVEEGLGMEECVRKTIEEKKIFRLAESYLGIPREMSKEELRMFWVTSASALGRDWVEFYKLHWRKWDSWAIGVLFLALARRGHLEIPTAIKPVLRGLLHASPVKRLTAAQALRALSHPS